MRLIDADALYRAFENAKWHDNNDRDLIAEDILMDTPTIEPTTPQWTSVKDGLPEEKASVLVAYIGWNDKKAYTDGCARLDGGWRWTLDDDDVNVEITHWMPLPEPPEEDAK